VRFCRRCCSEELSSFGGVLSSYSGSCHSCLCWAYIPLSEAFHSHDDFSPYTPPLLCCYFGCFEKGLVVSTLEV
jgi:hypothetical protein